MNNWQITISTKEDGGKGDLSWMIRTWNAEDAVRSVLDAVKRMLRERRLKNVISLNVTLTRK